MPLYLSKSQVLEIHNRMLALYGGKAGLRDAGALDAAIARPKTGYYSDEIEQASALFESIAQNHPFVDGNKRTAMTACLVFLIANGYRPSFTDKEAYDWLMGLYERNRVNKVEIEFWLRKHVEPI